VRGSDSVRRTQPTTPAIRPTRAHRRGGSAAGVLQAAEQAAQQVVDRRRSAADRTDNSCFGGRTLHNDGEVVTTGPGLRFTWRTSGVDAEGSREVTPLGPGRCRIVLHTRGRPTGAERFYAPLARAVLRRGLRADLRRFRDLVDAGRG
jgi:hypothetical protein